MHLLSQGWRRGPLLSSQAYGREEFSDRDAKLVNACVVRQRPPAYRASQQHVQFRRPAVDVSELGVADTYRVRQHGLENRLQFTWRTADNAQHLRRGRLLLQRLSKFMRALPLRLEQPSILDGDHGLCGKGPKQINLSLGETADL